MHFVERTAPAGLDWDHAIVGGPSGEIERAIGGAAVSDYDRDGDLDLFVVTGDHTADRLLRNTGNGVFEDVTAAAGMPMDLRLSSGPLFFDADGDGWDDLFVAGVSGAQPRLLLNQRDGSFVEQTVKSTFGRISVSGDTVSAAYGDVDRDGDFDLLLAHWNVGPSTEAGRLWLNDGTGRFNLLTDAQAGIDAYGTFDYTLAPNLVDLDGDGWLDIASTGDFGTSQIFLNQGASVGGLHFLRVTDPAVITDENGMGSVLQDLDADGDVDWLVTSIWDPDGVALPGQWGVTGNRLYRNLGDGTFEDATDEAGVRIGYWGWAGCAADFDLDGDLDLFHTNGWSDAIAGEFHADPSRLFLAAGDGSYLEASVASGIDDTGQGRGAICFDADRDGDVDVLVANNEGPLRFYRNETPSPRGLTVIPVQPNGAPALGARVRASAAGRETHQVLHSSCNYVSHQPTELVFGSAGATHFDELRIDWPGGGVTLLTDVAVSSQPLVLSRGVQAIPISSSGLAMLALALGVCGWLWLRR